MKIEILPQPDSTTCGPTCLHAMYRYFGKDMPLNQVIEQIHRLDHGGTLAVFLATHALRRGFATTIYTYNLEMFDPTWFDARAHAPNVIERLRRQLAAKDAITYAQATDGYIDFIEQGGILKFEDLTIDLIVRYLKRDIPLLTGLSATYLYHSAREHGPNCEYDDIYGYPSGHFVILGGYRADTRTVQIIDPMHPNPMAPTQHYEINIDRVIGAILLGVLTHDANLLVIEPGKPLPQASCRYSS
ncbi:MAG: C39 family peptidase [Chromatiales bacterium]|nr:C39 family peptidase [Chromatiales bacterium]